MSFPPLKLMKNLLLRNKAIGKDLKQDLKRTIKHDAEGMAGSKTALKSRIYQD